MKNKQQVRLNIFLGGGRGLDLFWLLGLFWSKKKT